MFKNTGKLYLSRTLSICTWFLKNRVWNFFQKSRTWFLVYFELDFGSKNQVRNRLKIKFVQLDFWKKFQTRFFKNHVQMDRVFDISKKNGFLFYHIQTTKYYIICMIIYSKKKKEFLRKADLLGFSICQFIRKSVQWQFSRIWFKLF